MSSRTQNRLSPFKISGLKQAGRYADGGGLYLIIDETRRSWIFRYSWSGSRCEIGLGSARIISLAKAREKALKCREMVADGQDPKSLKRKLHTKFGEYADRYVDTMSSGWSNEKHIAQWRMTLTLYAAPIRDMALNEISTKHVLDLLNPHWFRVPETADRLRMRIERVLDAARAEGLRSGDNPAR